MLADLDLGSEGPLAAREVPDTSEALEGTERNLEPVAVEPTVEVFLGRSPDCTVVIHDPAVSKAHARVFVEGDQVLVEDLGSTNGTWVGGDPTDHAVPLSDGAVVGLGRDASEGNAVTLTLHHPAERLLREMRLMETEVMPTVAEDATVRMEEAPPVSLSVPLRVELAPPVQEEVDVEPAPAGENLPVPAGPAQLAPVANELASHPCGPCQARRATMDDRPCGPRRSAVRDLLLAVGSRGSFRLDRAKSCAGRCDRRHYGGD